MRADDIRIECDEDGFYASVELDRPMVFQGDMLRFRIEDPEALYDAVRSTIGPWLRERDEARRTLPVAFTCTPDESAGLAYDLHDPKHPRFHSIHVDHYDAREGK